MLLYLSSLVHERYGFDPNQKSPKKRAKSSGLKKALKNGAKSPDLVALVATTALFLSLIRSPAIRLLLQVNVLGGPRMATALAPVGRPETNSH